MDCHNELPKLFQVQNRGTFRALKFLQQELERASSINMCVLHKYKKVYFVQRLIMRCIYVRFQKYNFFQKKKYCKLIIALHNHTKIDRD